MTLLLLALIACRNEPAKDGPDTSTDDTAVDDTGEPQEIDADEDGFNEDEDCDDSDPAVYPGAPELCNGLDDDCDGVVDNDPTDGTTWYADADSDSYGDDASTLIACDAPDGYAAVGGDCDDLDPVTYPDASERCDEVDNDCDGEIDEDVLSTWYGDADSDGWGDEANTIDSCNPDATYVDRFGDCDDTDASVNPDGIEVCNDVDDDCDGEIDNDAVDITTWYTDADTDGFGDASTGVADCDQPSGTVDDATDCDDTNGAVNPDADEVCNGIDDDCDGDADSDAIDRVEYFADADSDGYGDATTSTLECDQPSATVTDDTDCDDTDGAVNPAAEEVCNGVDDDCSGTVDTDATDQDTWYDDADSDGYGDASTGADSCEQPSGTVADDSDCDDADTAVNPGASEVCNAIDDDCNGYVDDDDPGLSDGDTWYIDYDSDGHGGSAFSTTACDQPTGYVADSDDCDDTDADVSPSATEYCNEIDDDCDGTVDEDDSADVTTWYEDGDSDGYGNASVSDDECEQPSGYVEDDTDCDDTDSTVYPDARERNDGLDNDCDGDVDEAHWTGSGADGSLTVSAETNLSTDASGTRSYPDAVAYVVSAISGADVTIDSAADGIAAGDEVLVWNAHGSDAAYTNVGVYEFAEVSSVSGATVTLTASLSATFGESSNADLSDQDIVMQRVPQYADVSVGSAGVLTVDDWDGTVGGVLAFRATDTVTVDSGGAISVSELGYWGGETGATYNCDSYQGESYAGDGDGEGDGSCTAYNESYGHWINNYGGGGAHVTGAGGNYAGGATDADSWNGGSATAPYAGATYGSDDLSTLFFGSGGAGVWYGGDDPGPGGNGAGIVYIAAFEISATDSAAIAATGGTTTHWATGSWTYGAGGGAGGSVWLVADELNLGTDSVDAQGGFGEATHIRLGGDGGYGRVRLDYNELNGYAAGTGDASTAEADVSEPDAAYSDVP